MQIVNETLWTNFKTINNDPYGAAVATLAKTWVHGETLCKWHNGVYGVAEDVEGVVNPAIWTISTK